MEKRDYSYLNANNKYEGHYLSFSLSNAAKKIFKKLTEKQKNNFFDDFTDVFIKCNNNNKIYGYSCKYKKIEPKKYKINFKTFTVDYKIICKKIYDE